MIQKLALAAFVVLLAFITWATLVPLGLRPQSGSVIAERMAAFALLSAALCIAYPRRWGRVLAATVLLACGLEYLQTFLPDRDGRVVDAFEKAVGAALGVGAALAAIRIVKSGFREKAV